MPFYVGTPANFRADIQGLRAIAILAVVAYHVEASLLPGGFVGVDIFFVISGYLISRILYRELEDGRFSLIKFYARRVRRLFPALFLMLGVVLAAGLAFLPPQELDLLARSSAATALFLANAYYYRGAGYFAPAAEAQPVLHMWSISVEEQFYLVFPLALFLLHRFANRRWQAIVFSLAGIASLLVAIWLTGRNPTLSFYIPVTRGYEFLLGVLIGIGSIPTLRNVRVANLLALAGLGAIALSLFLIDEEAAFPGALALLPCIGTALVIYAGEAGQTQTGKALGWGPMQFFGNISYSLYLGHWPLLVFLGFATLGQASWSAKLACIAAAVAIAWLSYRYVERPILDRKQSLARVFGGGTIVAGFTLAFCAAIIVQAGFPQRFTPRQQQILAYAEDSSPYRDDCHGAPGAIAYDDYCIFGEENDASITVVYGDSIVAELAPALGSLVAPRGGRVMQVSASACPPAMGYSGRANCARHNAETVRSLLADDRVATIVLAASYHEDDPELMAETLVGLEQVATALHGGGRSLVLVRPLPVMRWATPANVAIGDRMGRDAAQIGVSRTEHLQETRQANERISELAGRLGARTIDPLPLLCREDLCPVFGPDGTGYYYDGLHLTTDAARQFWEMNADSAGLLP